jgi:UDP-N-acetylmuramoyl-L-alanyl-D-glutamate--2,6-diaminopimelate ligase
MINLLRKIIPERSIVRKIYYFSEALLANVVNLFPSKEMRIIAVTGTSGKSSSVELLQYLFQSNGIKTGSLSGIFVRIGDQKFNNKTLRTTLRPWHTQKWLRRMADSGCQNCIIEVSSHAIDQLRLWGIEFDTVLVTNLYNNEHLDYHKTVEDYIKTKCSLLKDLNSSYRKINTPKIIVSNRDSEYYDKLNEYEADQKWSFSTEGGHGSFSAENIVLGVNQSSFNFRMPNVNLPVSCKLVGKHNVKNIIGALSVVIANGIRPSQAINALQKFTGIPGRMEIIPSNYNFTTLVDYSYKPSALSEVLDTLQVLSKGRIICVWGGAGGRSVENWQECAEIISQYADDFILTTDDSYHLNPKDIAKQIKKSINPTEGEGFFDIPDRFEAIRYAIFTAEKDDIVLIAGRGHEAVQTIGRIKINFDDRVIAREILQK